MIVLVSDQKHAVLLEETAHRQLRRTIENASFTSAQSKETYSFECLEQRQQQLLDYSKLHPDELKCVKSRIPRTIA